MEPEPPAPNAVVIIDSTGAGRDDWLHLLPVANRPLLFHILDSFAETGVGAVAVVVEPDIAPRVRRLVDAGRPWPFEIRCLHARAREGLAGALMSAGELGAESPLLVQWGGALFKSSVRARAGDQPIGSTDAVLLVEGAPGESPAVGIASGESPVVDLASERVAALTGRRRSRPRAHLAGAALLGASAPDAARAIAPVRDVETDLLAVVERMAELGGHTRALPAGRGWRHIGARDSALDVNRFVLEEVTVEEQRCEMVDTVIQGPARIHHSAILNHSIVRGPVVVGSGARLSDAYVGPYTSIGDDVVVEGAEIENSIVQDGGRICHLGGRLEASVVGRGASICRDFRLPKALRLHVGDGARVSLG